jgi:hypothetical protein
MLFDRSSRILVRPENRRCVTIHGKKRRASGCPKTLPSRLGNLLNLKARFRARIAVPKTEVYDDCKTISAANDGVPTATTAQEAAPWKMFQESAHCNWRI